jgi:hypothetical protein
MTRSHRRKPGMYNSPQALEALRRRHPDFSKDQLKRLGAAVLPPRPSPHATLFYSDRDLDMIVLARRLQVRTGVRYEHLAMLMRLARSEGRDEIEWLETLYDQARDDRDEPGGDNRGSDRISA